MSEFIIVGNSDTETASSEVASSPRQALIDGVKLLEEDLGTTFDWAGTNYTCAGGAEFGGKRVDEGGFKMFADLKIKVRRELFTGSLPKEGQKITYYNSPGADGKIYRIEAITNYWGAVLQLDCMDPNQGG